MLLSESHLTLRLLGGMLRDPAIDGEREYVNDTLADTGLVVQRTHVIPPNALTTAKTATGGEFHSDGRILILVLKNTASGAN